jgi:purine catabolism regulator
VLWDHLVDEGLLALVSEEERAAFAADYLAGLGGGRTSRPDLEATLDAFLRLHGRIGPTAEELGLHRNTVRNRLREVELLLGRSLDDPGVRVNAWLALQGRAAGRLAG